MDAGIHGHPHPCDDMDIKRKTTITNKDMTVFVFAIHLEGVAVRMCSNVLKHGL